MEYRSLPKGGEQIGTIGMGLANLYEFPDDQIREAISCAVARGVNYYDAVCGDIRTYRIFGECIRGRREALHMQLHLGACYENETYVFSRNLDQIRRSVDQVLTAVGTSYADFGFIHCIDEAPDFEDVVQNGLLDLARSLKRQGVIRHLGFSTHTPSIARRFLELDEIDLFMFSVNPAYDRQRGELAHGAPDERAELYRLALQKQVGISVMKPFSGGLLLDERRSPLGIRLSPFQCLQYALDRPAVLTCLPGCVTKEEVEAVLRFYDAPAAERDYSVLADAAPHAAAGRCVYCNHCAPCPAGIDVGLVNKYYDLARAGDALAASHYRKLETGADACIQCGHCDARCPFHVAQRDRMRESAAYFAS